VSCVARERWPRRRTSVLRVSLVQAFATLSSCGEVVLEPLLVSIHRVAASISVRPDAVTASVRAVLGKWQCLSSVVEACHFVFVLRVACVCACSGAGADACVCARAD
jgi:hypothetical protein